MIIGMLAGKPEIREGIVLLAASPSSRPHIKLFEAK
ncbi:hypothetical protein NIASO_05435 [Niabella soli DSM 19437]|uniref:Uncharacterized protein n=1 Tax=Niabella soli DSM 19437 TaxID=929713 RepID=W0F2P5_9BACT|nr:hypothetical protein NIASO_05435 [Niabella soli DSM 19437]